MPTNQELADQMQDVLNKYDTLGTDLNATLGLSVIGVAGTSADAVDAITATGNGEVLQVIGGEIVWAPLAGGSIPNDTVSNAMLRNSAGVSVIGRSANSIGDPADIVAGSNNTVLQRVGDALTFAAVPDAALSSNVPLKNAANTFTATQTIDTLHALHLTNTSGPLIRLTDGDATSGARNFRVRNVNTQLLVSTENDSQVLVENALIITANGSSEVTLVALAGDEVDLTATTLDFNGNLDLSGTSLHGGVATFSTTVSVNNSSFGAGVVIAGTAPFVTYDDTDAAADESLWGWGINSNQFRLTTMADATPTTIAATAINVQRSGASSITEIEMNAGLFDFNGALDVSGRITASSGGANSEVLKLVGNDTVGDCYVTFYEDDNTTRKGYIGYGNVGDDTFYIANEENAQVLIQTNATTRFSIASTGQASFAPSAPVTINSTLGVVGAATFTGAGLGSSAIYIETALPRIAFDESDATADNSVWYIDANAEQFAIAAVNDALSVTSDALRVDRTGTTIDLVQLLGTEVDLTATTLDFNGAADISGNLDVGSGARGEFGVGGDRIGLASAGSNAFLQVRDTTGDMQFIAGTDTVSCVVGAYTNHDLQIRTSNVNRITVENDGAEIQFDATSFDFNGNMDVSGQVMVGSAASDPTALGNGSIYYNTSTHKFRGRANGAWVDLH